MIKELLETRESMVVRLNSYYNSQWMREQMASIIKNFDNNVLWKYLDSKEVNSQLLEELKFYENNL